MVYVTIFLGGIAVGLIIGIVLNYIIMKHLLGEFEGILDKYIEIIDRAD